MHIRMYGDKALIIDHHNYTIKFIAGAAQQERSVSGGQKRPGGSNSPFSRSSLYLVLDCACADLVVWALMKMKFTRRRPPVPTWREISQST